MSTFNPLFEFSEQLCYVQCSFCNTILLVSVPCSSLLKTAVTVRCGHCQGLLSVNIGRTTFVPLQLLASLHEDDQEKEQSCNNIAPSSKPNNGVGSFVPTVNGGEEQEEDDEEEEEEITPMTIVVNKPPEKRQRAPSAYNRFIKEEIKRIKARHPNVSHKEAFSTAAKNWAHFPRIQQKADGDQSCPTPRRGKTGGVDEVDEQGHGNQRRRLLDAEFK